MFQSTLPQGERLDKHDRSRRTIMFQSTLPQGERRALHPDAAFYVSVSIHAPAGGATRG